MKSPKPKSARRVAPPRKPAPATHRAEKHILRLFVAGAAARSRQAILRVRELCAVEFKNQCELEVIDIYQQPALARKCHIVATPTLIIEFPPPQRRFVGNLTNITGLLVELDWVRSVKISA